MKKKSKPTKKKPIKKIKKIKAVKKTKKIKKPKKIKASAKKKKASLPPLPIIGYKAAANEANAGEVEDYFAKIGVIALTLKVPLSIGDTIHVHGHTTEITQKVESMQIEHAPVQTAKKGDGIGIKINDRCRKGDTVYKVS